jgi:sugar phosphate isomerase/epimerase
MPPLGVTAVMLAELDFDQQLALCGELGVTHYVYRPRHVSDEQRARDYHPHGKHKFDLTPERLIDEGPRLAEAVRSAGLVPFYSVPRGTLADEDAKLDGDLAGAAAGGCDRIRLMPPPLPKGLFDYDAYVQRARDRLARVLDMAGGHGLKVVIEMHAGGSACSPGLARDLVEPFEPERVGLIVDLPNFAREGYVQPDLALSAIRPWIDNAHVGGLRRTQGGYDEHGFRRSGTLMCPLTESDLDIPRWLEALAAAAPGAPWIVEDYTPGRSGQAMLRDAVGAIRRVTGTWPGG